MAKLTSDMLLPHTRAYVRDVFADRLRQEGFDSPGGGDTLWYRVVDREVVNTVCFDTRHLAEPVVLDMGYGIHPLFVEPFQAQKVYVKDFPYNFEILYPQGLVGENCQGGLRHYTGDVPVMIPHGADRGLHTLEGISLPKMNAVRRARDCYELHKARYLEESDFDRRMGISFAQRLGACSLDFVDEGIFFEDAELYPHFRELVTERLRQLEDLDEKHRRSKWGTSRLARLQSQRKALLEHDRQSFLDTLEARRKKVLDLLEKKYGVPI